MTGQTPSATDAHDLGEVRRRYLEHLATQITQTVLARLAPSLEEAASALTGKRRRLAIVAGTPGELHGIGARMVADFLEGSGWDVLLLGPDTPPGEIVALVVRRAPDIVALSTSLSFNLLAAGQVFKRLRELDTPPLLAGADVFAADPDALLRELALRLH